MVAAGRKGARVLIYSHDTFGLGHLRRCRTIAHSLVEHFDKVSVLILSGSPIIGSFDFRTRVDFVRIPGVIKKRNGEYVPLSLHMDIEETLSLRSSIIEHTAEVFRPDIFIVDKEPLGLRGEVAKTLHLLKERGTQLVLGLRDVLDDDLALVKEWQRKRALPALRDLYDQIWIYGLPQVHEPLEAVKLPEAVRQKVVYTGYLPRTVPAGYARREPLPDFLDDGYCLVTTGGGGDGDEVVDWVLKAYETDPLLPYPALFVLGPFMQSDRKAEFLERAGQLDRVHAITFDSHLETLVEKAVGVVAMGGYNTFCEILSFDKPAVVVPRTRPRMEQFIRASRAEAIGLIRMLAVPQSGATDPAVMAEALRALPHQKRPGEIVVPGLLEGLENVRRLAAPYLAPPKRVRRSAQVLRLGRQAGP